MLRVLLVDDDQSMCKLLESALGRQGYDVSWRTSAREGLTALRDEEYDVVVTDVSMSGMNGIELCEWIAQSRPDVPVVVVTAYGSLEATVGAMRAGAFDFITKPIEIETLVSALERAVKRRALRCEG